MLRLELDPAPAVVSVARRRARDHVSSSLPRIDGIEDLLDDVALVVSELVTNALVHGLPPITLEVSAHAVHPGCVVRVRCSDGGPWDGTPPEPTRGRGLVIVRALADTSIDADAHGTRVTATLHR